MIKAKISELRAKIQGGVLPAMASPLVGQGESVNSRGIVDLANLLIDSGVQGLFVGGTTGEGILLSSDVRRSLHSQVMKAVNGRVPVLLHVGTNSTAETLALAKHAQEIGAAAIAVVTPFFYGMGDSALFDYYQTVAEAVPEMPLLAYDIPQMAVNGISPALMARMGTEIPSFAGIKCSRPDAQVVRALIDARTAETMLLAGNEPIAAGLLALGADGLVSGFATAVPEPFVAMTRAFRAGDMVEVQRQQQLINRILEILPAGVRIGAIKTIIMERDIEVGLAVPPRRMPVESWHGWAKIKELLDTATIAS